jgi:hypothetical protein
MGVGCLLHFCTHHASTQARLVKDGVGGGRPFRNGFAHADCGTRCHRGVSGSTWSDPPRLDRPMGGGFVREIRNGFFQTAWGRGRLKNSPASRAKALNSPRSMLRAGRQPAANWMMANLRNSSSATVNGCDKTSMPSMKSLFNPVFDELLSVRLDAVGIEPGIDHLPGLGVLPEVRHCGPKASD